MDEAHRKKKRALTLFSCSMAAYLITMLLLQLFVGVQNGWL